MAILIQLIFTHSAFIAHWMSIIIFNQSIFELYLFFKLKDLSFIYEHISSSSHQFMSSGLFGREQDKRPIIIIPDDKRTSGVRTIDPQVITIQKPIVKPLEHDAGNTDIALGKTGTSTIIPGIIIKPFVIKHQPWTSFGYLENRIFIDDFCHEKDLTVKATANTWNGGTIKLKQSANFQKDAIKLKDEIKLWFPIFSRSSSSLHFRGTNEEARVLYDHGLEKWGDNYLNFYASFGFLRNWNKQNVKLGLAFIQDKVVIDHRLKIDNNQVFTLFHRTAAYMNQFRFGLVAALDLNNVSLIKKDFIIGYDNNDIDVSFKAKQPFEDGALNWGHWKNWFSSYTLTTVWRRNLKQRYGLQIVGNPTLQKIVGSGLVEYKYNDKSFAKIKFDSEFTLTLAIKNALTDKVALSFGAQIPLVHKIVKNRFGLQFEFNI